MGLRLRALRGKAAGIPIGYMHDGRARIPTEAIMWHSKEGAPSAQRFAALSAADRAALLAFLAALGSRDLSAKPSNASFDAGL